MTKGSVAERMHTQLAELLDAKDVPPPFDTKTTFRSIGLTSQSSIRYAAMLREEFHLDIRPTVMYDYSMVWDLVEYIESRLAIENKNDVANNLFTRSALDDIGVSEFEVPCWQHGICIGSVSAPSPSRRRVRRIAYEITSCELRRCHA